MKNGKSILCVLTALLLLLFSITSVAFGQGLTNEQDNQNSSKLNNATIEQMDLDMNRAGVSNYIESVNSVNNSLKSLKEGTIAIGKNKKFTYADSGNSGHSGSGLGTHGEGFSAAESPGWADSGTYLTGKGNIGSWAWIGNEITISGSGSHNVTVSFKGSYKGNLTGLKTKGSSSARVRVSIIDLGSSMEVGSTIIEPSISNGFKNYSGSISKSVSTTLEAGHSYALRFGISTASNLSGIGQIQAAFCNANTAGEWAPASGGEGITYGSIALTWN